jgi:hypothetical protein
MAYESGNPPHLRGDQPVAGPRSWVYKSTHLQAVVGTSDHINNGEDIGMARGDTVEAVCSTGSTAHRTSYHNVLEVASTYVALTAGLMISSAS